MTDASMDSNHLHRRQGLAVLSPRKVSFSSILQFWALLLFIASTVLSIAIEARAQVTLVGTQLTVSTGVLSAPSSVAVDGHGNIFVADRGNNRIVSITPAATGFGPAVPILSGLSSPAGVAADFNGNIFVTDTGNNRVVMLPVAASGYGSLVTVSTALNGPTGISVDSRDNLYIADTGNNRIVELPNLGSTYGSPIVISSGFSSPTGLTIDKYSNLFIADTGNNRVVKLAYSTAGYTTQQVLGKSLTAPMSVAVDAANDLYVADTGASRLVEEPQNGANRYTTQALVGGDFAAPQGIAIDSTGNIYVADAVHNRVMQLVKGSANFSAVQTGSTGDLQTYDFQVLAGTSIGGFNVLTQGVTGKDFTDAGQSTCTAQTYPTTTVCVVNVIFNPLGSGTRTGAVVLLDNASNPLATAYISGMGMQTRVAFLPGTSTYLGTHLSGPAGVAVDGSGNIFIADTGNDRVVEIPATGSGYGAQFTVPVNGLSSPMGLAVDAAANLYIASNGNDRVLKLPFTANGFGAPTRIGTGLYGPSSVAVDASGNAYITNTLDSNLWRLNWSGSAYAAEQHTGNYTKLPVGLAVDGTGNLFFTLPYIKAVEMLPFSGGKYLTQMNVQTYGISLPWAVAVDSNSNLYVVDSNTNSVQMFPWTGTGFGSQITVATGFNAPSGIAIDANGNLYIADTGNNQIVKIDLSSPSSFNFATTYVGSTSTDSTKTVSVMNTGNQPLMLTSVTTAADFPASSASKNRCTENTAVLPGGVCSLAVNFTPLIPASSLTETWSITDNNLDAPESTQSFSVSGSALGLLSQTIHFPAIANVPYGTAQSITLAATVNSPLLVTYQVLSGPATLSGRTLKLTGAGTVVVLAMQNGNTIYAAATPATLSFTITPAVLTVTPNNVTTTYGSIPTAFTYAISGFVLNQSASQVVMGSPQVISNAAVNAAAGAYAITASTGSMIAANYTFTFSPANLTVLKAVLLVKAMPVTATYGSTLPALTLAYTGLLNGDNTAAITGAPLVSSPVTATSPIGTYTVTLLPGTLNARNYQLQFAASTVIITPAALTVTAINQSITYGSAMPTLTYTITGFRQADSAASSLQGAPQLTTSANAKSAVGVYAITLAVGSLKSAKYTFNFAPGTLSVAPAVLSLNPQSTTVVYGSAIPALSYTLAGFVNGDTASATHGQPVCTTLATAKSAVGSYPSSCSIGTLSASNYSVRVLPGTFTIAKAVLTVTPHLVSIVYGSAVPNIDHTFSGFLNGDTVSALHGNAIFTTTATSKSPVGSYPISGSTSTLSASNYTFNFAPGALTVSKASLTIAANPATMVYGSTLPAITYKFTGLVNGDTSTSATVGALKTNTVATAKASVGSYAVTVAAGTLTAVNYTVTLTPGTLAITQAPLRVAANNATMKAGTAVPTLTYAATGFVNADTLQNATAGLATLTTSATKTSKAGSYTIAAAQGTLVSANYKLTLANGTLTVTQ